MKTKTIMVMLLISTLSIGMAANADDEARDSVYAWGHWNKLVPPAAGPTNNYVPFAGFHLGTGDTDATTPRVSQPPITKPPPHVPPPHHSPHHGQ